MGTLRRTAFRRRHTEDVVTPPEKLVLLDVTGEPLAVVEPPPPPPHPWRRIGAGLAVVVFCAGTIFLGWAGVHTLLEPARPSQRAFDGVVVTPRILDLLHPPPSATQHASSPVRHSVRPHPASTAPVIATGHPYARS
jgi:hypothetical protein